MSRGSADFSNVKSNGIVFSQADSWEYINRPQGLLSKDLRGQCILFNDFEDGTPNAVITRVGLSTYEGITTNNVFPGNFSFNMQPGLNINDLCSMTFGLPYLSNVKTGYEAIIFCNDTITELYFGLFSQYGNTTYQAVLQFDTVNDKVLIIQPGSIYLDITSLIPSPFPLGYYNSVKMVIDFSNNKYHRIIINGVLYDVSQYSINSFNFASDTKTYYNFTVKGKTVNQSSAFIDNIIITTNEP